MDPSNQILLFSHVNLMCWLQMKQIDKVFLLSTGTHFSTGWRVDRSTFLAMCDQQECLVRVVHHRPLLFLHTQSQRTSIYHRIIVYYGCSLSSAVTSLHRFVAVGRVNLLNLLGEESSLLNLPKERSSDFLLLIIKKKGIWCLKLFWRVVSLFKVVIKNWNR